MSLGAPPPGPPRTRVGAALLQLLLIQLREGVAAQSVNQSGSVDNSTDTSITTTTVGIVVTRGHYPHEITWMLSCNQSSEDYIGYAPFRGTVELVMGDDCVLSMADSYCDGWDTAALRIFDQLFTLESGCYDTFSFHRRFLAAVAACASSATICSAVTALRAESTRGTAAIPICPAAGRRRR